MLKKSLIVLTLVLFPISVQAFDLFGYMTMPDKPLSIVRPEWIDEKSHLRLGYEINEAYKEWRDRNKLTDYSGSGLFAELQANPVEHFSFGLVKRFNGKQTWLNKNNDKTHPFNFHSDNKSDGVFIKLGSERFKIMYSYLESDERFNGHYDLHEDIVASLGEDPDITFNTDGKSNVFKAYGEYKKFRLSLSTEFSEYKHCIEAPSKELIIDVNHRRKVRSREAELSYEAGRHWFPYVRFYDYRDTGDGRDYRFARDYRFPDEVRYGAAKLYGENQTCFKVSTKTIGAAYEYKDGWYYADYSRVFADISGHTFFNLVNIDPLFYFSTRFAEGTTSYRPKTGHMGRIGFKRHHRSIMYAMQYSLCKLHGNVCRDSEKTKFGSAILENTRKFKDLRLHRMDISVARPDRSGAWSIGLKAMYPQVKKHDKYQDIAPVEIGPIGYNPDKEIRGGWQLTVMREFKL